MWLWIKRKIVASLRSQDNTAEDQLTGYENAKKFYDIVYCSFQSMVFLAALQLAYQRYDMMVLIVFYWIGFFAWGVYLLNAIKYVISATIEKYTDFDLDANLSRFFYSVMSYIVSFTIAFLAPEIIVNFVNIKFPVN